MVLAVIGAVCPRKAQDIFVKAVGLLSVEEKQNVQFWIIGFIGNDEYGAQVRALAAKESTVKLAGPLTRSEICEGMSVPGGDHVDCGNGRDDVWKSMHCLR